MSVEAAVVAAWNEYLEDTRGVEFPRYFGVEPWAWARLRQRLEQILATPK